MTHMPIVSQIQIWNDTWKWKKFLVVQRTMTWLKNITFLKNCKLIVELVVMALRAFDGKQPCVGRAWPIMKTMEHVLSWQDQSFSLPWVFQMWLNNNLTIGGGCQWQTYIMQKPFSIHPNIGWSPPPWWCRC
jgi:hypothetical protein